MFDKVLSNEKEEKLNTEKLNNLAINETGFIFDPITGNSFTTNTIGIEIIEQLKKGREIQEISDYLLEEYDVGENELEQDVMDFVKNLQNFYLL